MSTTVWSMVQRLRSTGGGQSRWGGGQLFKDFAPPRACGDPTPCCVCRAISRPSRAPTPPQPLCGQLCSSGPE